MDSKDAQARQERVRAVLDGVFEMTVSPSELLAASQRGIEEIDRIASTAPTAAEELELLDLCEPLEQIVEQLDDSIGVPTED
ncbi:hypothetical protein [Kribbella kalugense]|uniref:Uncharacterized protein n=1 Tax=Kribbella kalugense TaxID=2512221 RepID=A0A4R8A209_9ACTN|nr:hypothetical protein [Kribbella kalugense]TDW24246.1 hypothetical protein EV650_3118 [Kribbella kalugense]